jgi:hypothetical protein
VHRASDATDMPGSPIRNPRRNKLQRLTREQRPPSRAARVATVAAC